MAYISSNSRFGGFGSGNRGFHGLGAFGCGSNRGCRPCAARFGRALGLGEWYERDDEPEPQGNSPLPMDRGGAEMGEVPFAPPPGRLRPASIPPALRMAIAAGNRDEVRLTNLLFNARHPERFGRAISSRDPGYQSLTTEWQNIRHSIVRPALRSVALAPVAPSGTMPTTGIPDIVDVRGIKVAREIAPKIKDLLAAAEAAGVRLSGGGYRSREEQIRLRILHCGNSQYDIYERPANQCKPPTAPPGRSNHERGLAIDFRYNGQPIKSRDNPGFQWLAANAARFGLHNLPSEPWHWSVDGR